MVDFIRALFGTPPRSEHRDEMDATIAELKRLRDQGCAQSRRVRDQAEDVAEAARESSGRIKIRATP